MGTAPPGAGWKKGLPMGTAPPGAGWKKGLPMECTLLRAEKARHAIRPAFRCHPSRQARNPALRAILRKLGHTGDGGQAGRRAGGQAGRRTHAHTHTHTHTRAHI
jgi:hypothetical protein